MTVWDFLMTVLLAAGSLAIMTALGWVLLVVRLENDRLNQTEEDE